MSLYCIRLPLLLLMAICLNSCQSISPSSAQVSSNNIFELRPPSGMASLVLIRPPMNIDYVQRNLSVKINGTAVVKLSKNSFTVINVHPGKAKIDSDGVFSSWTNDDKIFEAPKNQASYLIWYQQVNCFGSNPSPQWQIVSKEVAAMYIKDANYVPPVNEALAIDSSGETLKGEP